MEWWFELFVAAAAVIAIVGNMRRRWLGSRHYGCVLYTCEMGCQVVVTGSATQARKNLNG